MPSGNLYISKWYKIVNFSYKKEQLKLYTLDAWKMKEKKIKINILLELVKEHIIPLAYFLFEFCSFY